MNKAINVNGKNYIFASNYKDNDELRNSFNDLTRKTYGFDFEHWYQNGYWQERYIPYSLMDGNTVVSNVSVNVLDFLVLGERKRYVQLGTVMTDKNYRGLGLSRFLMEKALDDWQNKSDLIYLFANDSVLNFYPKFGFAKANEYQCSKVLAKKVLPYAPRKLDMFNKDEQDLLYRTASDSKCFSKISMLDNTSLIMFYCTSFMKDNVYYLDNYNAIVIAQYAGDTLFLQDIFCANQISVDEVIEDMLNEQTRKVVLKFTSLDTSSFKLNLLKEKDTTLFVKSKNEPIFTSNQLMFPMLSHA